MKKLFAIAVMLLFATPAHAELTEEAKMNERTASLYNVMDDMARAAYVGGISAGMGAILDVERPGTQPPAVEDIRALLNYCYIAGHCRHVSPRTIALAAYAKPSEAHKALLQSENENTRGSK